MQAHIIENEKIVNTIEIESLDVFPGLHLVDASRGGAIGDEYVDGIIVPAPVPELPMTARYMTVLAFRNRFTKSEKVRIELAAIDDPSAGQEERELAATVRVGQADLAAATYVDADRADTRADVQAFEAMGLLDAPGRALTILDDEILAHERHYG